MPRGSVIDGRDAGTGGPTGPAQPARHRPRTGQGPLLGWRTWADHCAIPAGHCDRAGFVRSASVGRGGPRVPGGQWQESLGKCAGPLVPTSPSPSSSPSPYHDGLVWTRPPREKLSHLHLCPQRLAALPFTAVVLDVGPESSGPPRPFQGVLG